MKKMDLNYFKNYDYGLSLYKLSKVLLIHEYRFNIFQLKDMKLLEHNEIIGEEFQLIKRKNIIV